VFVSNFKWYISQLFPPLTSLAHSGMFVEFWTRFTRQFSQCFWSAFLVFRQMHFRSESAKTFILNNLGKRPLFGQMGIQVRHHTQIDLLTCRVCFVKHIMITTQVRHHTYLDLSTCRVCSAKQMTMRQYFPRLWYDPYPLHQKNTSQNIWNLILNLIFGPFKN